MRPPFENDDAANLGRARHRGDTGLQASDQSTACSPPLYAIIERRRDGRPRIVAEYADPQSAHDAAVLMRWAGDAVEVVLVTAIRDEVEP